MCFLISIGTPVDKYDFKFLYDMIKHSISITFRGISDYNHGAKPDFSAC